jgi:hypothetical protein
MGKGSWSDEDVADLEARVIGKGAAPTYEELSVLLDNGWFLAGAEVVGVTGDLASKRVEAQVSLRIVKELALQAPQESIPLSFGARPRPSRISNVIRDMILEYRIPVIDERDLQGVLDVGWVIAGRAPYRVWIDDAGTRTVDEVVYILEIPEPDGRPPRHRGFLVACSGTLPHTTQEDALARAVERGLCTGDYVAMRIGPLVVAPFDGTHLATRLHLDNGSVAPTFTMRGKSDED